MAYPADAGYENHADWPEIGAPDAGAQVSKIRLLDFPLPI
jgi:hypothetical protein